MRPTTANSTLVDLRSHINMNAEYDSPHDVVSDVSLTTEQKRTLLASWASDANAVQNCPYLRAPTNLRRPVPVGVILNALKAIDESEFPSGPPGGRPYRFQSVSRIQA